tara:strand:+ start:402 stop:1358 length:957 start_codon:yes stop_codon:yes gene_type:complete
MNKRQTYKISSIILGIGIIGGLILYAGTSEILNLTKNISWPIVILATLLYSSAWILRSSFIKLYTHLPFSKCFKIISLTYMMNAILPAKAGDFHLIYSLKKRGINLARSANILIHYRLMDLFSLIIIAVPLLLIYLRGQLPERIINYLLIVSAIIAIPLLIMLDKKGIINKILKFFEQKISLKILKNFVGKGRSLYKDYEILLKDKKLKALLLSLSVWLIEGSISYLFSVAIKHPIPIYIIFLSVSIGNLSKVIPLTPGGLGIYEATVILLMSLFGIPTSVATLLSILDHILKTTLGVLIGALVLIFSKSENHLKTEG